MPVARVSQAIHHIHSRYGLLLEPTAGATYAVADWIAAANPESRVLAIFPDHGIRYMQTVYNEEWLKAREEELQRTWSQPVPIDSPTSVRRDWTIFPWARRSYPEVLGHGPVLR